MIAVVSLLIIVTISFADDMRIGEYQLKKAPIRETLLKEPTDMTENNVLSDKALASLEDELESIEDMMMVEVDSLPQSIFIFGDSMTYNLALRIAQYAKANGHTIHSVNWDSSNTKIWAETDTLEKYIKEFNPSFVFISLGSNEVYLKHPEVREPCVKKILETIGDIPYVWIGPPNWTEDTGFNNFLASECKKGSFFLSQGIKLERKKDKIHPTREASALWVDSIMRWLPKSAHPIVAELPPDSIGKANPNIIFLKALNK